MKWHTLDELRSAKRTLWDTRSRLGRLLFLPLWPANMILVGLVFVVSDFFTLLDRATKK